MKKAVPHTTTLWCTAKLDRFYAIYLVLTKEMSQMWHLWQELLRSTSKTWETWRHQLHSDGRFESLINSNRSLTWAYTIKSVKSSSQISATIWLNIFLINVIIQSYASQCCYQYSNFKSLRWLCWSSLPL